MISAAASVTVPSMGAASAPTIDFYKSKGTAPEELLQRTYQQAAKVTPEPPVVTLSQLAETATINVNWNKQNMPGAHSTAATTGFTPQITREEAAAMARAAFRLFERWGLSDAQARILLGEPSSSTFYRWKRGEIGSLPRDTTWRLGDLMGIHKALRYMFREPDRGYAWIKKPNDAFGGQSALHRMLAGAPSDLTAVRAYLDAERGGW